MAGRSWIFTASVAVLYWFAVAMAATREQMYPFGIYVGDASLDKGDDLASPEIHLSQPIKFFGEMYDLIFVSNNGLVSFVNPIPEYQSVQFPLEYLVIAPLYANVDTSRTGTVWYRESREQSDLESARMKVTKLYPYMTSFEPVTVFIATWENVGHLNSSTDERNTYQLAISTDGDESFVEMIYLDGGIQWIQTRGESFSLPDAKAQAGLVSHDGRAYTLKGSGTDGVRNLDKWTNGYIPGEFVFRVGNIGETENVELPPSYRESDDYDDTNDEMSCDTGGSIRCHSKAECWDKQNSGFCCKCLPSYYGNGRECIISKLPLRANGKVTVAVNGQRPSDLYLQAYIQPDDGASYTAVSNGPPSLGNELQLLESLGSVLGWLFAKPVKDAPNGYEITGGVFNHTSEIVFDSGHRLLVTQRFTGLDIFDQLKVEAEISGFVPSVPPGAAIVMPDYNEEFIRIQPGVLRSEANHVIKVAGIGREHRFSKNQTVHFIEYCSEDTDRFNNVKLKSTRHTLSYKPEENVLRFSSFNKISRNVEGEDPCLDGQITCVANSSCVADGDSFKCICSHGFQTFFHDQESQGDFGCHDINECIEGSANCHPDAICVNEIGTYYCQCRPGFSGDGVNCHREGYSPPSTFRELQNMDCQNVEDINTCRCRQGFREETRGGGGYLDQLFRCIDIDECRDERPCSPFANCYNTEGSFNCVCREGTYGDGFNCEEDDRKTNRDENTSEDIICNESSDCPANSYCDWGYFGEKKCICSDGFSGTPPYCEYAEDDCFSDSDCHHRAFCGYNNLRGRKSCTCHKGFVGDGYKCEEEIRTTRRPTHRPVYHPPQERTVKTCYNGVCWCPPEYVEEGDFCIKGHNSSPNDPYQDRSEENETEKEDVPCNIINNCHENAVCVYYTFERRYHCQCKPGFEGDGHDCSELEISCSETGLCDMNAACKYLESTGRDTCICNEGYLGDGINCYPADECSTAEDCGGGAECVYDRSKSTKLCVCSSGQEKDSEGNCVTWGISESANCNACHPKAECHSEPGSDEVYCRCPYGMIGDGITECREDESANSEKGCDVDNRCSPQADCIYSDYDRKYICICKQGYEGDGYVCFHNQDCSTDSSICSEFAQCAYTEDRFQCRCNDEYVGNGTFCKERPNIQGGFVLLNKGRSTLRLPLQPNPQNNGHPIHFHTDQVPIGITVDCVEGKVYWSDIAKKSIHSSNYDGTDMQQFVTEGIDSSEGLAVDWVHRNLYWTDSGLDTISRANLDTKERIVIISQGLVNPRGIAVHPWKRKIYWSDWDRVDPKIESANLDGRGRSVLLKGHFVKLPNSLAIDWTTEELCWADAGTSSIECLKLTSGVRRSAVKGCKYPFGLAITPERYYWTDWVTHKVESADKDGLKGSPLQLVFGGDDKLYGIAAVTSTCP